MMYSQRTVCVAIIYALTACARANPPLDDAGLGNEAEFRPSAPLSWTRGGTGNNVIDAVGTDVGVRHAGSASAYLSRRTTDSGLDTSAFLSIGQRISAAEYRGTRVKLSAYVRADSVVGHGAGLWMRIDSASTVLGFDNMIDFGRPIIGTTGWLPYEIVLDVPQGAVDIVFGALLNGHGLLRVDDVGLETSDDWWSPAIRTRSVRFVETGPKLSRFPTAPSNLNFESAAPLTRAP